MKTGYGIRLLLVSLTVFVTQIVVFADGYTVQDLGIAPGKLSTTVYGNHSINQKGEVVGHCNIGNLVTGLFGDFFSENIAFVWTNRQGMQPLPLLNGRANATGWSLNDRGQIIGMAGNSYLDMHGVLWEKGTIRDLGALPGDTGSFVQAINNHGQIVGMSGWFWGSPILRVRPCLWEKGCIRLLPMAGLLGGQANDINEKGQIVGELHTAESGDLSHAVPVLWEKDTVTLLGSLGGDWGYAWDINDRGQIIGQSQAADGSAHAFFWEKGVFTDLGTRGGMWTSLWALNNHGQAVGEASDASGAVHAILVENGVMGDLNDSISPDADWVLVSATGINDRGQISGYGLHHGLVRGFILIPGHKK